MSAVMALRGGEAVPAAEGDETAAIATEFLLNHPAAALRRRIALAVLAVLLVGGADWLAVFHVVSLKFTDAMGQPIGSTAGLVAMSGVTLIGYVLIGTAWGRPERWAKAVAVVLYAVVLVLLGLAIAPVEIGNIRDVWASLAGGASGFGAASAADDAPWWFVAPCLFTLAVAFSLFGLVFLVAKSRLGQLLALWRWRDRAAATLERLEEAQDAADQRRLRAVLLSALETPEVAQTLVQAALRQGFVAYRDGVTAQATAIKSALANVSVPKAEKQRLTELLADAGACLKSIPAA